MARFRHILLTLASGSALYSGMAPALGLGDISLHSALNQPLEADIELIQASDLTADEIRVRLASSEDFERSGVDRFMFLNDLRFSPIMRNGKQLIRVVSSKPVREPYLNFIVELSRPGGNLLREYTLLIDPPGSAAYTAVAASNEQLQAPVRQSAPAAQPAQPRPMPSASSGQRYQVRSGDSLWTIAGRLQAAGSTASRDALMADIHALNPQAFSGGDRNRLQANADLLLPDSAVAGGGTVQAAVAAEQSVSAPAAPAPQETPGTQQLQATQRELDLQVASQGAENQQLQTLIGDLQAQLLQLQTQMAEKDEQLAAISAQLEQQRQAAVPVEPVINEAPPASAPAAVVPAEEAQAVATPSATSSDAAPATARSSFGNWSLWLGGLALLLGLLAGFFLRGRRQVVVAPAEPVRQPVTAVVAQPPAVAAVQPEPVAPVVASASAPLMPRTPTFSSDALEGANIYIAYGRFGEARNALRKAIEHEPARLDLRLRLLEVLGELGDAKGFADEEQRARELGANPVQIEQIRARYSHVQPVAEPVEPLADAVLQLDEPAAPASEVVADDFQLNLDDLSLDADWDLVSPFKQDVPPVRGKVITPPAFDPAFRSNLRELPEVEELAHHESSPFGEELLNEEFVDAFAEQPLKADLEHLAGNREHLVTLNMALAYIDQGDIGSACDILNELISEGDEHEKARARELLAQIA